MKTINNSRVNLILLICFLTLGKCYAGNYTWNGSTSTSWNTTTNWTPNGTPGVNDTVTIVTGSNDVYLSTNTSVKQLTINSGTIDLQSYTLNLSATGNFNSGYINNGVLNVNGTATQTCKGTQFGAKVYIKANSILLNGSTFNDSLFIVKKGTANDNGKGNNTFNSYVSIIDSSSGNLVLSDSFPDVFNGDLEVNKISTGNIYLAHRGIGNQFNGNVTFKGSNGFSNYYGTATYSGNIVLNCNVYFGYGGGSSSLSSGKTISIGTSGISSGLLYFKNFNQLNSTGKITLTLTGTAQLYFESGSVFNDSLIASAPSLFLNGSRFNGVNSFSNTGSSNVTSTGGCYFNNITSIYNNCLTAITYSLSTASIDTFTTTALLQNNNGTFAFSKTFFNGNVTLKNANIATGSDRFFISSVGQSIFKGTVTIDNTTSGMVFGNTSGTTILDSTGSLAFASGFTGNITLKRFTQIGNSNQTFTFPSASSKLILGPSSTFNGSFNYYGHYINVNGVTFNSNAIITRYGTSNEFWSGGNIFNGTTTIRDSCGHSNNLYLAYSSADTYNGDVTYIQKGTGVAIYPAYNYNSTYSGNITLDGTSATTFGQNGGKVVFGGSANQSINRANSLTPIFKKIKIDKEFDSFLTLNSPVNLSDSLYLYGGIINTDTLNYLTLSDNCYSTSGNNNTFINGPLKKIGNDSFTFPVGNLKTLYHPLKISSPTNTSDAFIVNYLNSDAGIANLLDSCEVSSCEHWQIKQVSGSSSINIFPGLRTNACAFGNLSNLRLAVGDSTGFIDEGFKQLTYNDGVVFLETDSTISFSTNRNYYITNAEKQDATQLRLGITSDPLQVRALYVNKFFSYDTRTSNIDAANSTLGVYDAASSSYKKEEELLQYAQKNNINLLICYDFRLMSIYNVIPPGTPDNFNMLNHFCRFINRAKNEYCIKFVGVAFGGDPLALNAFENFQDLFGDQTPAMALPSYVTSFLGSNNPFSVVTQTYSPGDPNIYYSEYYKTILRAISATCSTTADIDVIANEYEFWLQKDEIVNGHDRCTFRTGGNLFPTGPYCNNGAFTCKKQPAYSCMFRTITDNLNLWKITYNATHSHRIYTALYSGRIYSAYSLGGVASSAPSQSRSPYDGSVGSRKMQILLSASEMDEKGYSMSISDVALYISSCTSPGPLSNFTISLKETSNSSLTSTFETGSTVVYGPVTYTPLVGINNHHLPTPFVRTSASNNLIVEICFDNAGVTNTSNNSRVYMSDNSVVVASASANACSLTTGTTNAVGPNVMLNYNLLDIAQFVDGVTQASNPSKWDVIMFAPYTGDPTLTYSLNEYPQTYYAFQDSRTANQTAIHPIFNVGTLALGDEADFLGKYLSDPSYMSSVPMSQRNIFDLEKRYYDSWKADPLNISGPQGNVVTPGAVTYFMSSYLLNNSQNEPAVFQTNSPQCVSPGNSVTINFTYQGPLEKNIVCSLEVYTIGGGLVWSDPNNPITTPDYSTGSTISFTSHSFPAGEYEARLTMQNSGSSCNTTYVQRITVSETPRIDAILYSNSSSIEVCEGNTVALQASNVGTGGSYQWYHNGYPISGATSQEYAAKVSGDYKCNVVYGSGGATGCSGMSNSIHITVNTRPIPFRIAILCNGSTSGVDLAVVPSFNGNYRWSNGATSSQINVTSSGYYSVELTTGSNNECRSSSSIAVTTYPSDHPHIA